jgi:aryl-alcohol dehydrogenase-like predicted oxidoreductase
MQKRQLVNIEVSPVGMGCMAFSHGYGDTPSEEYAINAIQIHGHRGIEEFEGDTMRQWNREKQQ